MTRPCDGWTSKTTPGFDRFLVTGSFRSITPYRIKVISALEDTLLGAAPIFEEYLQAVRTRSSEQVSWRYDGADIYALMKHWPEDIHRLMYDLQAHM